MLNGFSVTTALIIAVLLGVALTAYLWLVRRKQSEARAGIEALSAMRWREFSRLVIEALQPRGFVAESIEDAAERGLEADLRLNREGRLWLLSCKQGANYRITTPMVRELADGIRFHGAAGGILATPGTIEADARKAASGIELYDGNAVWTLVKPLLPPTLHNDLANQAQARTARETAIAWGAALILGFVLAAVLAALLARKPSQEPSAPAATEAAVAAPDAPAREAAAPAKSAVNGMTAPAPADPNREEFERNEVIRGVSAVPGIERVMWSTRSTLVVYLREDDGDPVNDICAVLERYETLRVSRLHLQPPAGSTRPVRFLQCRTF
ncbi:restriction endonuclease [Lysobacter niastensis]|uniref:Restriction endonuclease n=1 Tax=Lysobacter niastensis TaxID=380629 RepID=A0ABS0B914_9GAMM|nr:restriction endonuclease [Lysobacter niastensis]MBF6024738.1 restriction endonuclease [Lysobacter niastensis]